MRANPFILGGGLLVFLPLLALLMVSFGRDPRAVPSVLEGRPAPAFSLETLDTGETVSLADLRGQRVVINFWATWCQPCKIEHPALLEAARRWPDVQFLGVLYQDEPIKARAYLRRNGEAYPTLLDPGGVVAIDYGVGGVPETYFLDEEGQVFYKHAGPLSWDTFLETLGAP